MNTTKQPLVSVMIPYYNCEQYIAETIASVEAQHYPNIEIIIVDDGSSAESAAFLAGLLKSKPAIRLAAQNNRGAAAARNHAARLAKGEYFLFLDADDQILPDYIQKSVAVLEGNPDCKLVYPQAEFFDAKEGFWQLPPYEGIKSLLTGNRFPSSVSMHRAADFKALGGFDENFATHEDWDFWIRLLSGGGKVYQIPEVLFRYRKRRDGSSLIDQLEQNTDLIREDWQHIYEKHRNLFLQYHLGYWDHIQTLMQAWQLAADNGRLQKQNEAEQEHNRQLQADLSQALQQADSLQQQSADLRQQLSTLQQESTNLHRQLDALQQEKHQLEQTVTELNSQNTTLSQRIQHELQNLAKYKGLWTVKAFKPIVKTEQAISSANRYRKGFRLLVREKGSIGKAYQYLRRNYKQTRSIKSLKQILKLAGSNQTFREQTPMPEVFKQKLTKQADKIFSQKVAIIAELSIPQCKKYRVIQKQEMLQAMGIPCSVTSWTDFDEAKKQISLASLVIFYRVPGFDSVMALIDECRRLNIKTLWDVDDLIFDAETLQISSTINSLDKAEKEGLINGAGLYRKAMLACDEGIASTSGLAQAMREAGMKNVYVVENALDEETLVAAQHINGRLKDKTDSLVRIIYGSGTKTHNIDFLEAAPALAATLKANPNVMFRIIGYLELPEYFDSVKNQIERIPFCNYTEYLTYLSECDISIAPLENFIFNDAKSNIKYLEASITKVASICSPRAAFADVINHGANGLLADNEQQWFDAFDTLIKNAELRKNMAEAAYRSVTDSYGSAAIGKQIAEAVNFEPVRNDGKTKILSFNVYYYPQSFGGATVVAEQLNKLLAEHETHEVYAVTTLPPTSYLPPYNVIRYEYRNVTVFGVAVPGGDQASYDNPRFSALAKDIIELVQPDIAHIHCIQGMGVGIVDLCKQKQVKTVVTLHDAWWICSNQFMLDENNRFREQWDNEEDERSRTVGAALGKIDMLLAPSKYFAGVHERKLGRSVYVNKNGVTRPLADMEKRRNGTVRFGYVGGMTPIKGVHLILEAFKRHNFQGAELVVVDNMLNVGSQSFFDRDFKGIQNYRIVPAYNQDTIDQFFSEIDVLLFPTQWKESFGLTVREAVLRDVWVIATDAGGVSEDIIDGGNGTIIPFDSDAETLAQVIRNVCKRYDEIPEGTVINLPKDHIRTFAEQQQELSEMYRKLLAE
ncbi:glycosyltransferase [Neisseria dentiae]|uniref:glycosyltransferase n=1 Tax=Neisseria dentiae TaxID=194197 RepID=UPI00211C770F|nr:glycosyltransferase [Neisseria dentiae]MCQ9326677.1 glycosyltransferase [Neisseria dentiae]